MGLILRKANAYDKKMYLNWANDGAVRAASFDSMVIKEEDHEKWFKKKLEDKNAFLFVCMDFLMPLGQVRIERDEKDEKKAFVSYSVDASYRGRGIGRKMLALMQSELLKDKEAEGIETLCAEVKNDNASSAAVFESLGYKKVSSSDRCTTYEKKLKDASVPPIKKNISRETGLELLRILAMFMVITLHYLGKGGMLPDQKGDLSVVSSIPWILEAACLGCVNVYVIISGLFAEKYRFSIKRIVMLWLQVFFYSAFIYIIFVTAAIINGDTAFIAEQVNVYNVLFFLFPVVNGHYWFAGAFIILSLFMPFIANALKTTDKKTHLSVVIGLLTVYCISRSCLPFELIDDRGNGVIWFLVLYITASYIGRYGLGFMKTKLSASLWYVSAVLLTFLSYRVFAALYRKTGGYEYGITVPSAYNFIFVLISSVALVMLFKKIEIKNGFLKKIILGISPYVFGVYLLHEHLLIRYSWLDWLHVNDKMGISARVLNFAVSLVVVFTAGVAVDFLRAKLFVLCERFMDSCMKIYYDKKEGFDYLITGGLTTVFNWVAYVLCADVILTGIIDQSITLFAGSQFEQIISADYARDWISNVIAWVVAVIFAYATNRVFVFHSDKHGFGPVFKEFMAFVTARVLSFVVEQVLFTGAIHFMNDKVAKLLIGVVVIILNYIFSKLWIFKKEK